MEREKVPADRRGCGPGERTPSVLPRGAAGRAPGCRSPALPRPLSPPPRVLQEGGAACGQAGQADLWRCGVRSWKHQESMLLGEAAHLCQFVQPLSPEAQLFSPSSPARGGVPTLRGHSRGHTLCS